MSFCPSAPPERSADVWQPLYVAKRSMLLKSHDLVLKQLCSAPPRDPAVQLRTLALRRTAAAEHRARRRWVRSNDCAFLLEVVLNCALETMITILMPKMIWTHWLPTTSLT
eukprot:5522702-Pyramimonas_sp.AAC.1